MWFFLTNQSAQRHLVWSEYPKPFLSHEIKYVAGVDVSYAQDSNALVAGVVVLEAKSLEPVESAHFISSTHRAYVPGFLSFRELPPLLKVLAQLKTTPDLIVCDGQGVAHPRRLGVAAHLGLWLERPTLGCAKSALLKSPVPGPERGDRAPIIHKDGTVGYSLRTRSQVKAVYVSAGHLISHESACEWVLQLAPKWRLPETTRQADQLVGNVMRELKSTQS